jgi:prepilin-type N-terminal cleavage/methylation domain-containing protein
MTFGRQRPGERGFTLLEMMIALLLILPVLYAATEANSRVNSVVAVNEVRAHLMAQSSAGMDRIAPLLRSTVLSTAQARATPWSPWTALANLTPACGVRFRSSLGPLWLDSTSLTEQRTIEFILDDGEASNSSDDDGDGLVDEGQLILREGSTNTALLADVTGCQFMLDGNLLSLSMTRVRRSHDGLLIACTLSRSYWVRSWQEIE